jgi:hypothetical protein
MGLREDGSITEIVAVPRDHTVTQCLRQSARGLGYLGRVRINRALLNPSGQDAERGKLFQRDLVRELQPVLMRSRISDSLEAASPELHRPVLSAAPCLGVPVTGETKARLVRYRFVQAECLAAQLRVRYIAAAELLLQACVD